MGKGVPVQTQPDETLLPRLQLHPGKGFQLLFRVKERAVRCGDIDLHHLGGFHLTDVFEPQAQLTAVYLQIGIFKAGVCEAVAEGIGHRAVCRVVVAVAHIYALPVLRAQLPARVVVGGGAVGIAQGEALRQPAAGGDFAGDQIGYGAASGLAAQVGHEYGLGHIRPAQLHGSPGGEHHHYPVSGGIQSLQQFQLVVRQAHMAAVLALGLPALVQTQKQQTDLRLLCQVQSLYLQLFAFAPGTQEARGIAHYVQAALFQGVHGAVHPDGIYQGTARPLISGQGGKIADDGYGQALFQGQDMPLVFQQHRRAGRSLPGCLVVDGIVEALALAQGGAGGEEQLQISLHRLVQKALFQLSAPDRLYDLGVGEPAGGGHLQAAPGFYGGYPVVVAAPVGDDHALIAPFIAQDIPEQVHVLVGKVPVDPVIGTHEAAGPALRDGVAEALQIYLPESPLIHHLVHAHAPGLLAVHRIVLDAGGDALGLYAPDHGRRQFPRQIGVLGEVFKVPAAEGVTLYIQARAQYHAHVLPGGLLAYALSHFFQQLRVPAAGQGGGRGETGGGQTAVEPQMVGLVGLLPEPVGAVGEHHIGDAQALYAFGVPEVGPGAEGCLLLQSHPVYQLFVLHFSASCLQQVQGSQHLHCGNYGKAYDELHMLCLVAKGVHPQPAAGTAAQQGQKKEPVLRDAPGPLPGFQLVQAHGQHTYKAHETEPHEIQGGVFHLRFLPPGLAFFLGLALAQPFLLTGFLASAPAALSFGRGAAFTPGFPAGAPGALSGRTRHSGP